MFIRSSLPSASSVARWFGEPVRAVIINTNVCITKIYGVHCTLKAGFIYLMVFMNCLLHTFGAMTSQ